MKTWKAACSKHSVVHTVEGRAQQRRESKHIYKCKIGMGMGGPVLHAEQTTEK